MLEALISDWQKQSLGELLDSCAALFEDLEFPTLRAWREQGGKTAGHFQVYFPEEIAHAAGMLPIKLRGAPVEVRQADSHFGSYLCSILKTSLELALSDRLQLDLFVTHPICDAARNLAGVWSRNFSYPSHILYLPQNANSRATVPYLRGEYGRIRRVVEEVAGCPVSNQALRQSIQVFNENRALIRELYRIRRETPWLLAAEKAYVLTALAGLLPREDHNQLLKVVIPLIRSHSARPQDKIRVVFEGGFCEQPPLDLIRVVSQSCYVVDDDFLIGLRWLDRDVALEGDPLENLAVAYIHASSYSPVQHDSTKPKEEMLLKRIREAGAEAAIITAAKMCEPGLEEQVCYSRELDREGIPYFVSEFEENMTSFDHLQIQLETFVENLLFD